MDRKLLRGNVRGRRILAKPTKKDSCRRQARVSTKGWWRIKNLI